MNEVNEFECYIVNVFSDKGIKGGNQLGVITDSSGLSSESMLDIAKQLNYSESTFIESFDEKQADVRIFLPVEEIDFAGHPTVGTAYILMEKLLPSGTSSITINLKGGSINTHIEENIVFMEQLAPNYIGKSNQQDKIMQALNLTSDYIQKGSEFSIYQPTSLKFLFILVKDPNVLQQLDPNLLKLRNILSKSGMEPYLVSPGGIDGGDFHARFFAPGHGIPEDPATGSAQAALMDFLNREGVLPDSDTIIVEQGYEMGRPSKIYNRINRTDNEISVKTGGNNHIAGKGILYL